MTVSHSPAAVFGQAPFLANATLALLADIAVSLAVFPANSWLADSLSHSFSVIQIIRLHARYRKDSSLDTPPQVPEPTQAGLLRAVSPFVLPPVEAGQAFEQTCLEGPWSGALSGRPSQAQPERAAPLSFDQQLEHLRREWQDSLQQELDFSRLDSNLLPWRARGEKELLLDRRGNSQAQQLRALDEEAYQSEDRTKRREFSQFCVETEAVRAKLKLYRGKRHQFGREPEIQDLPAAASSYAKPHHRPPFSLGKSSVGGSLPSKAAMFTLPRRHRPRKLSRHSFYPRRGVGTYLVLSDTGSDQDMW